MGETDTIAISLGYGAAICKRLACKWRAAG